MKTKLLLMLLVAAVAVFALSAFSSAAEVILPNPGFEARITDDLQPPETDWYDGRNKWMWNDKDGWYNWIQRSNGGYNRLCDPGVNQMFGGEAPEGLLIMRSNSRYVWGDQGLALVLDGGTTGQVTRPQVLFDPNTPYVMTVEVGNPYGGVNWSGYRAILAAGDATTEGFSKYGGFVTGGEIIAEDYNSETIGVGEWKTVTVVYDPAEGDPNSLLAGKPLQIRLLCIDKPGYDNDGLPFDYVAWDDVRLKYGPVNAGADMVTWSGQPVQLAPTFDDYTPSTFAWSADPADGVVFSNPNIEAPTVTITKATDNPSTVTLTLEVDGTHEGSMEIDVYDDACTAAIAVGLSVYDQTDLDENCVTDIKDLAAVLAEWLADYKATGPAPKS